MGFVEGPPPSRAQESATTKLIENGANHDVFGDGSVMIIAAHGHTPGHRVLLVKTEKSGAVLIAGDMLGTL